MDTIKIYNQRKNHVFWYAKILMNSVADSERDLQTSVPSQLIHHAPEYTSHSLLRKAHNNHEWNYVSNTEQGRGMDILIPRK